MKKRSPPSVDLTGTFNTIQEIIPISVVIAEKGFRNLLIIKDTWRVMQQLDSRFKDRRLGSSSVYFKCVKGLYGFCFIHVRDQY